MADAVLTISHDRCPDIMLRVNFKSNLTRYRYIFTKVVRYTTQLIKIVCCPSEFCVW